MSGVIYKKKVLAKALKNKQSKIIIEGKLATGTIKIILVGDIAWATAFSAIGLAVISYMATPVAAVTTGVGGAITVASAATGATAAVAILGAKTTVTAIGISVASGGVGVLTTIRNEYNIVEQSKERVVLVRK